MKYIVVASLLISAAPLFARDAVVEKPQTQSSSQNLVECQGEGKNKTTWVTPDEARDIFFQICREQTALSGKPKDKDRLSEEDRERAAAIKKQNL